jgi:glycosyltransferase involved in cell wall biosynthesis
VLNAIDPSGLDPSIAPGPVRRELGLPEGVPVVVSISRLFHWKGHADLLRAMAVVRREVPEARLVIVGEEDLAAGGLARPGYMAELKQLAGDLGLKDHVLFTGFRGDVPRMLAAADVFALPSFQEPFGLVFLEAMAMKRPVVALDNGGTPEVVEHGKSGLLSPARDPDALAANLLTLIRDPALRARMGECGRRAVETRFTPARMARDVERVYTALCGDGERPPPTQA